MGISLFVKIIKKVCKLACDSQNDSNNTNVKDDVKMRRNSVFYASPRHAENLEFQKVRLYELCRIKAKEKCVYVAKGVNHKVAYANNIESDLAIVPSKDKSQGVKDKQKARDELQQNQKCGGCCP